MSTITIILIAIISIILVVVFVNELANFMTYGGLSKMTVNLDRANLNSFNASILMLKVGHISTHASLFSKYHIDEMGCIPRWSKFHKEIEAKYKQLLNQ